MLVHSNPFWIAACEQSRTGGSTNRGSYHEACEFSPLICNTVDVWSANCFRTKTAQIPVALIISKDDYEIWFSCLRDYSGY